MKRLLVLTLTVLFLLPLNAFAGYYILQGIKSDDFTTKMGFYLDGEYKRIDYYFEGKRSMSMISSPDYKKALLVDHRAKTYMESDLMTDFMGTMAKKGASAAMEGLIDNSMGNSPEGFIMKAIFKGSKKKKKKKKKKVKMPKIKFKPEYVEIKPTSGRKVILDRNTQELEVYYKGKLFQRVWATKEYPEGLVEAMHSMLKDEKLFAREYTTDLIEYQKHTNAQIEKYGVGLLIHTQYKGKAKNFYDKSLSKKGKRPKESTMEMEKMEAKKMTKKYFSPPKSYEEIKLPSEDDEKEDDDF